MRAPSVAMFVAAGWLLSPVAATAQIRGQGAPIPGISITPNTPTAPSPPATPGDRASRPSTGPRRDGGATLTNDVFLAAPWTYAPRYDRPASGRHNRLSFPFGYSPLIAGYAGVFSSTTSDSRREDGSSDGRLLLRVVPKSAQVFVDGFYTGTVDDLDTIGHPLVLEAGSHTLELRADGYETETLAVRITAGEVISYQRDLRRADAASTRTATGTPKTFYVIPGCYAGDASPSTQRLPAGCQLSNLRTVPPIVSVVSTGN